MYLKSPLKAGEIRSNSMKFHILIFESMTIVDEYYLNIWSCNISDGVVSILHATINLVTTSPDA